MVATDVSGIKVANPDKHDEAELKRVLWRCRRGLLELDIMLMPFVANQYADLSGPERHVFDALLDLPDNSLWDMMSGRVDVADEDQRALLEKIKAA